MIFSEVVECPSRLINLKTKNKTCGQACQAHPWARRVHPQAPNVGACPPPSASVDLARSASLGARFASPKAGFMSPVARSEARGGRDDGERWWRSEAGDSGEARGAGCHGVRCGRARRGAAPSPREPPCPCRLASMLAPPGHRTCVTASPGHRTAATGALHIGLRHREGGGKE